MSALKPIPAELLTDCAVLRTPAEGDYTDEDIIDVRIVRTNAITDYTAGRTRDCTELVMYFDCESSYPQDVEFAAGQTIVYCEESYEITSVELFSGTAPHHYRIKARKTDGTFRAE